MPQKITLVNEVLLPKKATLTYSQTDTCGNSSNNNEKQIIKRIEEGGWKIDEVEISL